VLQLNSRSQNSHVTCVSTKKNNQIISFNFSFK
jgi:hypothetical protein